MSKTCILISKNFNSNENSNNNTNKLNNKSNSDDVLLLYGKNRIDYTNKNNLKCS